MKTMKWGKTIVRVSEKDVKEYLSKGYTYCPKHIWKDEVRVIKKKKEAIAEKIKEKTTKRGKKSETAE